MDREKLVWAFNEWMRRYTEDPAAFDAEIITVVKFLQDRGEGRDPTYGEHCVSYLEKLISEI